MAEFQIQSETESARGWRFEAKASCAPPADRGLDIRLSWSDYDLWGRGSVPPVLVARALLRVLDRHGALDRLGPSFDASTARSIVRTLDDEVPEEIASGEPPAGMAS